jgi:hypothetical protein
VRGGGLRLEVRAALEEHRRAIFLFQFQGDTSIFILSQNLVVGSDWVKI